MAGGVLLLGAAALAFGRREAGTETDNRVTVALAPPIKDRIWANPRAATRPIVVLDAGHGGHDPGAISVSGEAREKELTLTLARELRDELVKRGRVRVAMTRDSDSYLTLEDRSAVARRLNASLFLSLHMDSAPNPLARGATVYSLSDVASDAESERLAALQNRGRGEGEAATDPVDALLSELAVRSQMTESADLAARLVRKTAGQIELRPEPHRFAAFHVLRSAGGAAVLFEAGYLSNAEDEAMLRSPEARAKIVLALAQAIEADVAARASR
ncbi:N-acetylmuramoyl-L-alanine amidase [Sphingomonas piscis]|uniref:N-acetylmuramoyl-L-alanine amidase n=1 Tax=Sphingomonas piscis TaxID=2714943 RepID=A0A6G7YRH6_9SPHN|nr:N-acetylmuramoyl-L-alanine amidase [Sphingomonas piscis]QIK79345.1 N-acetylmuramoyl-L-alanine amidase [Sphingomonas piscis]